MSGGIFINYRRGEDSSFAGRLYDRLEQAFPAHQLFMDVDNIAPGLDFVEVLDKQVQDCDVLLAVIGQGWLAARDEQGERRLDHEYDFVRVEIGSALQRGKRVIPVLVGSTNMVRETDLPPSLKSLARRNAVRISHEGFRRDCDALIRQLKIALEQMAEGRASQAIPPTPTPAPPPPEPMPVPAPASPPPAARASAEQLPPALPAPRVAAEPPKSSAAPLLTAQIQALEQSAKLSRREFITDPESQKLRMRWAAAVLGIMFVLVVIAWLV